MGIEEGAWADMEGFWHAYWLRVQSGVGLQLRHGTLKTNQVLGLRLRSVSLLMNRIRTVKCPFVGPSIQDSFRACGLTLS